MMATLSPRRKPREARPRAMSRPCSKYSRQVVACQIPKFFSRMAILPERRSALERASFGNVSCAAFFAKSYASGFPSRQWVENFDYWRAGPSSGGSIAKRSGPVKQLRRKDEYLQRSEVRMHAARMTADESARA